jgi:hypothetical protein
MIQRILCNLLCRPAPTQEKTDTYPGPAKDDTAAADKAAKSDQQTRPRSGGRKPA